MRRRTVPALITLLAAVLAAWRRRAGRGRHGELPLEDASPELAASPRRPATDEPARAEPPAPAQGDQSAAQAPTESRDAPAAPLADAAEAEPAAATPPTAPERPDATPTPRFVSIPWTLAIDESAARARQELPIGLTLLGDRMELDRVDVRETESQVFVTVLARWDPPDSASPWVPYGIAREAVLRLDQPLGDRALVHAPDQLQELLGATPAPDADRG